MPRPAAGFRQTDLARAVRGAKAGGMKVARIEIDPSGKIVLIAESHAAEPRADLDHWLEKQRARSA